MAKSKEETDIIHAAIVARYEERKFTVAELVAKVGGSPNKQSIRRYLDGRASMSSELLSRILVALELEVKPIPKVGRPKKDD